PPAVLTVPGEAGGALLGALQPWSRYRLQVQVFNGRGAGPPSAEIRFHTPEGGEKRDKKGKEGHQNPKAGLQKVKSR
ncbi:NGCA protein, partial [Dicaeum eximium]|nr:NGCA protein [Dicaeum eximium]